MGIVCTVSQDEWMHVGDKDKRIYVCMYVFRHVGDKDKRMDG